MLMCTEKDWQLDCWDFVLYVECQKSYILSWKYEYDDIVYWLHVCFSAYVEKERYLLAFSCCDYVDV